MIQLHYICSHHLLYRGISDASEQGSEAVFGGTYPIHHQGEISWIPMAWDSHWQLVFEG